MNSVTKVSGCQETFLLRVHVNVVMKRDEVTFVEHKDDPNHH